MEEIQIQARLDFLRGMVRQWEEFIADFGGERVYVQLFGHSKDPLPKRFGPGGNRLYEGDLAQLECLKARLKQTEVAAAERKRMTEGEVLSA